MPKDYARAAALAKEFIKCIGDDDEGENPSLPSQTQDFNDGGQESLTNLNPIKNGETGVPAASETEQDKKDKKNSSIAMMGSMLASKFKK